MRFTPETAAAARWLGVKVAVIRHAPQGCILRNPAKPHRTATFCGQHPDPASFLGDNWWLLEEQEG